MEISTSKGLVEVIVLSNKKEAKSLGYKYSRMEGALDFYEKQILDEKIYAVVFHHTTAFERVFGRSLKSILGKTA